MTLDGIRNAIAGTDADEDWHQITCWGAGTGPSYRDRPASSSETESHSNVAILKVNIDISIAWGLELDERAGAGRARTFDWEDRFPSEGVSILIGDVFYRAGLVDRVLMASVDGGRCLLPWAITQYSGPHTGKVVTNQWWYDFTYLIDGMEGQRQFDEYWRMSEFQVVD